MTTMDIIAVQEIIDFRAPLVINSITVRLKESLNDIELKDVIRELKRFQSELNNCVMESNEDYHYFRNNDGVRATGLCDAISWFHQYSGRTSYVDYEVRKILIKSIMDVSKGNEFFFPLDENSLINRKKFVQSLIDSLVELERNEKNNNI